MKLDVLCDGIVAMGWRSPMIPEICHITHDSRKVEPGSLFVAIEGLVFDGNQFIAHACQLGAVAVLTSKPDLVPCGIPTLVCSEPRKTMALLARKLYGFPDKELRIVGVTGTDGKTTTAFILDQLLAAKGLAGRIGTLSNYTGVSEEAAVRATPESSEVYQLLREMVTQKCVYASMEISSHALMLYRVWGLTLQYAVFMNMTKDHLDYHKTMENYLRAKLKIFELLAPQGIAVINSDDPYGQRIASEQNRIATFGRGPDCDLRFEAVQFTGKSSTAHFFSEGKRYTFQIPLIGLLNLYNFAAAALVARLEGISWEEIQEVAGRLKPTPGRMESLNLNQPFDVVIDFAHSPEALENVLKSCRTFTRGKVHLVFGAGGNRDREQRPLLGLAASGNGDRLYATSDNPRMEDPLQILNEVTSQIQEDCLTGKCQVIVDRREAIKAAINQAGPDDLVLIAGKGHESTQEIAGVLHPFNDRDVASELILKRKDNGSF